MTGCPRGGLVLAPGFNEENDRHLCDFIMWLTSSNLHVSTTGNYLSQVNQWHIVMRKDGRRPYSSELSPRAYTLKSIAAHDRILKEVHTANYKMAAGTDVVRAILDSPSLDKGVKAACVTCFFALLRRSEATECWNSTTRKYDVRLTRRHVRVRKTRDGIRYLELIIVGKGNVNNAGRTRAIGEVRGSFCDPVALVEAHLRDTADLVDGRDAPVFVLERRQGTRAAGTPVTGDDISRAVKHAASRLGLKPELYASHSLRIGGASALAAAGMRDSEIMVLGRWTSWTFLRYLRMGVDTVVNAAVRMANTNVRGLMRA